MGADTLAGKQVFYQSGVSLPPGRFIAKVVVRENTGGAFGSFEAPILVPQSDDVLVAGDVVTLEPGAYVEGIGGMRFEHNYLITENGYERLSTHTVSLT